MDDDDRRAEIADLRRRVFGPQDGPVDPGALARLRELEERDAAQPVGATTTLGQDGRDAPSSASGPELGAPAAGDPGDDRSAARRTGARTRIRPRLAAAWAASLVIAAVAAAGGTAWWLGDERGTVAMLELEPPPVPDNATYLSVDTGSIAPGSLFAPFDGIAVGRVPRVEAATGDAVTCLVAGPRSRTARSAVTKDARRAPSPRAPPSSSRPTSRRSCATRSPSARR